MTAATLQRGTPMAALSGKPKTCKAPGCKRKFTPSRLFEVWCSPECGLAIARGRLAKDQKVKATAERKADKVKREKLKTRSDWIKDAQKAFNSFIRARDMARPCICCGLPLGDQQFGGSYDAGHYRSVGSAPHLRFDERNCHAQRKQCNQWGAGRAVDYRIGLIQRLGLAVVEELEADQAPRRYDIEALRQIRDTYRAKANDLQRALREAQPTPPERTP